MAHLEISTPNPAVPAYQAAENTPEKPSSTGVTPPSETPAKTLPAAGTKLTNPGSTTALVDRQSTVPPLPQATQPAKPSVAEAQHTDPGSTLAPVNQRSSGVTPPETPAKTLPAVGTQRTDPESTTARPPEAERNEVSSRPTLTAEESAALLARGDDYLRIEDVASARLFYEHVADAGSANAALRLGETFDPVFLDHAQMHGIAGDMKKAIFWYRRARELGSTEAGMLLKQLDAN